MKITKTCDATQLEFETRSGWALIATHKQEGPYEFRRRSTHEECQRGAFEWTTEHGRGERLVFVLEKDAEAASREAVLEEALSLVRASLVDVQRNLDAATKATAETAKVAEARRQTIDSIRATAAQDAQVRRKLEGDLAKVRKAIGELRMKEILETP